MVVEGTLAPVGTAKMLLQLALFNLLLYYLAQIRQRSFTALHICASGGTPTPAEK